MKKATSIGVPIALTGLLLAVIDWVTSGWGGTLTTVGTTILVVGVIITAMSLVRRGAVDKARREANEDADSR